MMVGETPSRALLVEALYRDSSTCACVLQGPELRCVVANSALCRLLGSDPRGRRTAELFPELSDVELARIVAVRESRQPLLLHDVALRRRDACRQLELACEPLLEADGSCGGVWLTARDISEHAAGQQRSLAALREELAKHRTILERMDEALLLADVLYDEHDHPLDVAYLSANPAAQRMVHDDWSGKRLSEIDPNFEPYWREILGRVALTGEGERLERYAKPLDAWYDFFVFKVGQPHERRVAVIAQDVTAQKRAQEELTCTLESISDAFFAFDADWRIVYVNAAAEKLLGAGREQLLGRVHWDVYPLTLGTALEHNYRCAANGEVVDFDNFYEPWQRWFHLTCYPRPRGGISVYFRDITEQKQAQLRLEEVNERLQEADRRKDEFMAMLSHELRNPLAPIKNALHVLEHTPPDGERARRAQEVIGRQADQLARLVDDLLDVTRITRKKVQLAREPLDLNELVQRTVEDHRSLFEKREIALSCESAPVPVYVEGDRHRLAQVIGNLLQNAAKFSSSGSLTRVEVSTDPAQERAVVKVIDRGVGMTDELSARLFQPFMQADTTLDRSQGGLGLGLALVKGLVELHGGEVGVHSAGLGRGAEFSVRLPLLQGAPAQRAPDVPALTTPRRVLVIEDNVDAAESLRDALELDGHEVIVALDGAQGLALARDVRPEVVLCDIGLPQLDGYAVARALRADPQLRETHLIALSGYAQPADTERARQAGFDRHLAKPPSLDKLEAALREVPEHKAR